MNAFWEKQLDNAHLLPSTALRKQEWNTRYLMELKTENLLFPYYQEAGLSGSINYKPQELHGGWDAPGSQIRGTFTAHWLSAAAYTWAETKTDQALKAKADYIVSELRRCQEANGGQWVFPIPPKYILDTRDEKASYWAPLYVCHKVLMGLLDMYRMAGNETALQIIRDATPWFLDFARNTSRETLTGMMDRQETGGLMETWADLYGLTGEDAYLELLRAFERPSLYTPLLEGKDPLTNMHANTTIPEIHGAARAYEVTGEERYRRIVELYWKCAVTERGCFCTGGQTSGEVWTPKQKQSARLSEFNQEHCVVYNMIRLADYLYRWTGEKEYADYIERNIVNGLFAQGHWEGRAQDSVCDSPIPPHELVCYYLPLQAGSQKKWGSATEHFWCCHCTLLQANSRLREFAAYRRDDTLTIAQYLPFHLETELSGGAVTLELTEADLCGSCNRINGISAALPERPDYRAYEAAVTSDHACTLRFRIPWWIQGEPFALLNGEPVEFQVSGGYLILRRKWAGDVLRITFPKGLTCQPLPDEPETVAFLDGGVVLAGLVGEERMLYGDQNRPESMLRPHCERKWSEWQTGYKTFRQPVGFYWKPLNEIGHEVYTIYFPVEKKS